MPEICECFIHFKHGWNPWSWPGQEIQGQETQLDPAGPVCRCNWGGQDQKVLKTPNWAHRQACGWLSGCTWYIMYSNASPDKLSNKDLTRNWGVSWATRLLGSLWPIIHPKIPYPQVQKAWSWSPGTVWVLSLYANMLNPIQIPWLTHSSPQFFNQEQWRNFLTVHKKNRTKAALALKFEAVVMAVLSLDLLIHVNFCIILLLRSSDSSNHPFPYSPVPLGETWNIWNQEQCHWQLWCVCDNCVQMDSSQDPPTVQQIIQVTWGNKCQIWGGYSQDEHVCSWCDLGVGQGVLWV